MFFSNNWLFLFPELFLAFILLIYLAFFSVFSSLVSNNLLVTVKYHSFSALFFVVFLLSFWVDDLTHLFFFFFYNSMTFDFTVWLVKFAIFFFSLFFLKASWDRWELILVFLLGLLGILFLASSNDFMLFFTSFELLSLVLYILAGSIKDSLFSAEASLKYFVFGSLASIFILLGISLLYASTGLLNFTEYALLFNFLDFDSLDVDFFMICGLFFLLSGFLVKLGLVPFHFWVPSVYLGSPLFVVGIFAVISKMGILYIFTRLFFLFNFLYFSFDFYGVFFLSSALLSILFGFIGAWGQQNIRLFVAYSGIGNTGLLVFLYIYFTSLGFFAFSFYFLNYFFLYFIFFLFFFLLGLRINTWNGLLYLIRFRPFYLALFVLLLFSMAGLPPLAGFWSKFFVITSLLDGLSYDIFISCFISFFVSFLLLLSTLYYFRILTNFFFSSSLVTLLRLKFSFSFLFFALLCQVQLYFSLFLFLFRLIFNYVFNLFFIFIHDTTLEDFFSLEAVFFFFVFHQLIDVAPSLNFLVPPKLLRFIFTQIDYASSLKEELLMKWKVNIYLQQELLKIHALLIEEFLDDRFCLFFIMPDFIMEERVKKIYSIHRTLKAEEEKGNDIIFFCKNGRIFVDYEEVIDEVSDNNLFCNYEEIYTNDMLPDIIFMVPSKCAGFLHIFVEFADPTISLGEVNGKDVLTFKSDNFVIYHEIEKIEKEKPIVKNRLEKVGKTYKELEKEMRDKLEVVEQTYKELQKKMWDKLEFVEQAYKEMCFDIFSEFGKQFDEMMRREVREYEMQQRINMRQQITSLENREFETIEIKKTEKEKQIEKEEREKVESEKVCKEIEKLITQYDGLFKEIIEKQKEILEKEKIEKEIIEKQKEKEILEKEKIEKEILEKEKIEKEIIEKQKEKEKIAKEKYGEWLKEKIEKEKIEKEKIEKEKIEKERCEEVCKELEKIQKMYKKKK